MKLEIKGIYSLEPHNLSLKQAHLPLDTECFHAHLQVDIGVQGLECAERFHFVAASPAGLQHDVNGRDFHLLRGYILMEKYDLAIIRRAIQNLIDHAGSSETWTEAVQLLSRYGRYDSEDL
jgi:hypothetical protein